MNTSYHAMRQDRERGHVAMAVVRYVPSWPLPAKARAWQPWACTFHDEPGGPKAFIAFGGEDGMLATVEAVLGKVRVKTNTNGYVP